MTRVALVQLDVNDTETIAERVERAGSIVEGLVDVELAVLPELWHVGAFDLDAARDNAEPMDGSVVTRMRAAAADSGHLAARRLVRGAVGRPPLQHVGRHRPVRRRRGDLPQAAPVRLGGRRAVGDDGGRRARRAADAARRHRPRDLLRPALPRALPPPRRLGHRDVPHGVRLADAADRALAVLARARAIENQAWVVACNTAGTHHGVLMGGRSIVVDPRGTVVAEAGVDEEILYADVDVDLVREWRRAFPVLADRRL